MGAGGEEGPRVVGGGSKGGAGGGEGEVAGGGKGWGDVTLLLRKTPCSCEHLLFSFPGCQLFTSNSS